MKTLNTILFLFKFNITNNNVVFRLMTQTKHLISTFILKTYIHFSETVSAKWNIPYPKCARNNEEVP